MREMLGVKIVRMRKGKHRVEQWMGISTDEALRMRDSPQKWILNRYPLIEMGMSRSDCIEWWRENYPN